MSENREEILANFQACTGIDDLGEAFQHLEYSNWDLVQAINRAVPQLGQNSTGHDSSPDVEMIGVSPVKRTVVNLVESEDDDVIICNDVTPSINNTVLSTSLPILVNEDDDSNSGPSTSQPRVKRRKVKLQIEYNNQLIPIEILENRTVGDLKIMIRNITDVPTCQQLLLGWKKTPKNDSCSLESLNLEANSKLTLVRNVTTTDSIRQSEEVINRLPRMYTLNIKTDREEYSLKYAGAKTILDVKNGVHSLTNIAVRHQVWTGWPNDIDDSIVLACSGIDFPIHSFTLRSSEPTEERKKYRRIVKPDDSDDSSIEEFEDAAETFTVDDDIFMDDSGRGREPPLLPDLVEDEMAGVIHFIEAFTNRYGPVHPEFFPGTLDDVIKDACMKPARERRLLAVYLHHDLSVLTQIFCTQLLCCESVVQCLSANFVVWGWDLTFDWNKLKFLGSLTKSLGAIAAQQIRNIPIERFPAIIIISRVRAMIEINAVIQGNVGVNELMASLTEALDVFDRQQKIEIEEEAARIAREMIIFDQDAAYRLSLETDRAKEEAKKQQEMAENEERQRIEEEKLREEEKKETYRQQVSSRLPSEPSESSSQSITKLRFRLPKGESIERRFLSSETLQTVLDFLVVQGYPCSDFKVISSWPRRDLTEVDATQTLQQLKFCSQETVIVEER